MKSQVEANVTWKDYVDAEFRSVRSAVDKVEATNKQAVDKVEEANTARFESVNEFRGQLKDQAATFVTRRELWGAVITIVTIIISVAAVVLAIINTKTT